MTESASSTPPCQEPALERLLGSWELGLLSSEEALRVEAHVLGCDACFESVYASAPVAERLTSLAGRHEEAARPPTSRPRGRRRSMLLRGLAASILIAAVLAVLAPWEVGENAGSGTRGAVEPGPGKPLTPIGEVARPERLEWEPVPGARDYRVRLSTARGLLVWEATVESPPAKLPQEVREALAPAATYYWQFEALGGEDVLAKSPLTGFNVQP